jgi:hypothetical protein
MMSGCTPIPFISHPGRSILLLQLKNLLTFFPNTRQIFMASTADGAYFSSSMALMVWRVTCTRSASSACEILRMARSTRIVFFMD